MPGLRGGLCALLCSALAAQAARADDPPPPPAPPSASDDLPPRGEGPLLDGAGDFVAYDGEGPGPGTFVVSAGVGGRGGAGVLLGLFGLALVADAAESAPRTSARDAAFASDPAVAAGRPPAGEALSDRAGASDGLADGPYRAVRRRRREAREGFLFSLGIGGAQNYLSGAGHAAGFAFDVRMGYGFSDRFQLFFDLSALPASYGFGQEATSWTGTVRGQTVLLGDRQGNGLNLNLGVGFGGLDTYGPNAPFASSRAGLAVAGGLSVDLRVSPWFAISPELTAQWHQVPNDYGFASDIHRAIGGQLNFVWYNLY